MFASNTVGMTAAHVEKDFLLFGVSPNHQSNFINLQHAGVYAFSTSGSFNQNMQVVIASTTAAPELSVNIESFAT